MLSLSSSPVGTTTTKRAVSVRLTWLARIILTGTVVLPFVVGCGPRGTANVTDDLGIGRSTQQIPATPPPVFYVDPWSPAARQATAWAAEGRTAEAALLGKISERPVAKWLTGGTADVRDEVDRYVERATIAGQIPVLVTHYLPERDCGRKAVGGAPNAQVYVSWIRAFAAGIKGRPVIVIVEPNGVADAVDGCVDNVAERYALLRDAVNVLKSTGSARVYLDAGHPQWIKNVQDLAAGLDRAGIALADGFALNVASFFPLADNLSYGHRISNALGGKVPFVIDTSRNGNGAPQADVIAGAPSWCNPPARALGQEPTDNPGLDRVDALLWIKYPGESDGSCRPGEPATGMWWPEYALDLARRSAAKAD